MSESLLREQDNAAAIVERVAAAVARQQPLRICGSGSKTRRYDALAPAAQELGQLLNLADHCGIVHYAPDELVLEARAGTPLAAIEQQLAAHDQMLAFEPPRFAGGGTLGGAVAVGLSGPARPWRGALRDAVLGVELVNGYAERLQFGGRVVKNVAGYDLSRLQAGAFGTLGVLLRICVRVLPRPPCEVTLVRTMTAEAALRELAQWSVQPLPFAGSCYHQGQLHVRLLGAPEAVAAAVRQLGGEAVAAADLWASLRDQSHDFFAADVPLWRLSVPLGAPALPEDDAALIEWGGAQRWYRRAQPPAAAVRALGGRVTAYADPGLSTGPVALTQVAQRLRRAFDPQGLFNPGLLSHAH